ncbi:MAG: tRNA epoxyqueuosine(34) reductase QueG [Bacteroidetes bacterium GWF2_40_14]|nr:MAG: tRNA epoxyqueuosine(34) reductase QueG [Bacteroidetes bacterium GWF2_40_14]
MNIDEIHKTIEGLSREHGFLEYGSAPYRKMIPEIERLREYLDKSYNAGMDYMARNVELRADPELLLKGTKSIMCFLAPYKPEQEQSEGVPKIASYAFGEDYHKVVKDKLYTIVESLKPLMPKMKARVFVDSAPVMEREWAREAGLGFIGKNNFLISKKFGIHTFIGIILINQKLKYSTDIVRNGCGNCNSCIEACPTGALMTPFCLDARKCISYQTIESKCGHYSEEFQINLNNSIFGCDICLKACPWAAKGEATTWKEFKPVFSEKHNKPITDFSREDWKKLNNESFLEIFKNSPIRRAGILKIQDNL